MAGREDSSGLELAKSGRFRRARFVWGVEAPGSLERTVFIYLAVGDAGARI